MAENKQTSGNCCNQHVHGGIECTAGGRYPGVRLQCERAWLAWKNAVGLAPTAHYSGSARCGGYVFTYTASKNEQQSTQVRDQTERDITLDNQREAALQAYIDKVSGLLLHEHLRESTEDAEVRKIARVRTLTVLPRLDNERKRTVLLFLQESGLLDKHKHIVTLSGANLIKATLSGATLSDADLIKADLSQADLSGADLSGATLRDANLSAANLSDAHLIKADLSRAKLFNAKLGEANLSGANLREANLSAAIVTPGQLDKALSLKDTLLQDGSKHP